MRTERRRAGADKHTCAGGCDTELQELLEDSAAEKLGLPLYKIHVYFAQYRHQLSSSYKKSAAANVQRAGNILFFHETGS